MGEEIKNVQGKVKDEATEREIKGYLCIKNCVCCNHLIYFEIFRM